MDYAQAQAQIGDHAPSPDSWLLLPLPLATPLSALGREALYVLKLAHNLGRVADILGASQLPHEDTYKGLVKLIEERYLFQAFIALHFLEGPHVGTRQRFLPGQTMILGRGEDADVVLLDERASRKHARLIQHGRKLFVEDLGSRNGTYVNGELIATPTTLTGGDRVLIGDSVVEIGLDYRGYQRDPVTTMELQKAATLESYDDFDIDLEFSVDTAVVETVGEVAEQLDEADESELQSQIALSHPLEVPLDVLTSWQLDVLQLAHNFLRVEAILMNAPGEHAKDTLSTLRALVAQGYLEQRF